MYKKNRILWAVIISIYLILTACPMAVSAGKPDLVLEKVTLPSNAISKGDTFTAAFVLRNNSYYNLKNIYLQVVSTDFSVVNKGSVFLAVELLNPNSEVEILLQLKCHDMQSNRIPLLFTYENYAGETLTMNEQLLVTFKEIPVEICTPAFSIIQGEIKTIGIGTTSNVNITIKNISQYRADNIAVTPVISEKLVSDIIFNQLTMKPENISLEPGEEKELTFNLTINGITAPGIYPITYELLCRNKKNEVVTSALTGYIKVTESKALCDIRISEVFVTPEVPVRGSNIKVNVKLVNCYQQKLKNFKVWLEGLPPENFSCCENQQGKIPDEIDSTAWTTDFVYTVAEKAPEGSYPYEVHLSYTDPLGNSMQFSESHLLYLQPEKVKMGNLSISNLDITNKEVLPDKEFSVGFDLNNSGAADIEDIEIAFNGSEKILASSDSNIYIDKLAAGEVRRVEFQLIAAKQQETQNLPVSFQLKYDAAAGEAQEIKTMNQGFSVRVLGEKVNKGILSIGNLDIENKEVLPDKEFNVGFDLYNTGAGDIENIEIAFNGSGQILAYSDSNIYIDKLAAGEVRRVEFQLIAAKVQETQSLPVSFQLKFDAAPGEAQEIKTMNQGFSVRVLAEKEDTVQPKIVINSVGMPAAIISGEPFDLSFTLKNTSQGKNIRNIKLTASSIDPVSQISNILILGQSDSLYISELACGEEARQKLNLEIPDTFCGTVCGVRMDFSYEDTKGNPYTAQEMIYLPVTKLTQLTASDVRIGNVREGGYSLELDFYNTGKGLLKNLMVDLEGDFEAANSNYYVGDLQSGRMDIYSVAINGDIPEKVDGNVIFSYEDTAGSKKEVTVPFHLNYTAPVVEAAAPPAAVKSNPVPYKIIIAGLFFAVLIMIAVIRKKKKAAL